MVDEIRKDKVNGEDGVYVTLDKNIPFEEWFPEEDFKAYFEDCNKEYNREYSDLESLIKSTDVVNIDDKGLKAYVVILNDGVGFVQDVYHMNNKENIEEAKEMLAHKINAYINSKIKTVMTLSIKLSEETHRKEVYHQYLNEWIDTGKKLLDDNCLSKDGIDVINAEVEKTKDLDDYSCDDIDTEIKIE